MTPHINLFDISGSGEPAFPYLVTTRLSRDIAIFVKRREIVVEINHERVKSFLSSLFVLLRFGTDKHQVYRRNSNHAFFRVSQGTNNSKMPKNIQQRMIFFVQIETQFSLKNA